MDTANTSVLLICAPAGSGKSVLLADWLEHRDGGPYLRTGVAWCTVTDEMNEGTVFWAALRHALGVTVTDAPRRMMPATQISDAVALGAALASHATPTVLVIDDAHLLTDAHVLAGLEHFLQNSPLTVTTIISGRVAPPLRWHSLDLRGGLTRLGFGDLTLTAGQVAELCGQHGCRLSEAEVATVLELTEGWPALVRIVASQLADHPAEHAAALTALARAPHAVSDYLADEFITDLPVHLRMFLTYTSILDTFTESLADALVGDGAEHAMHELGRLEFPLTSTLSDGEQWFEYHPILRSHFRAEANRLGRENRSELHIRAADWFRDLGLRSQALRQLLEVPDRGALTEFLSDAGMAMVLDGDGADLFEQLQRSQPALADDPFVWLLRVVAALIGGDTADAAAYLAVARARGEQCESFVPACWLASLTLAITADLAVSGGIALGEFEIPESIPSTGQADIDCYAAIQTATALVARGEVERGEQLLKSGLALAEHAGRPRLAIHAVTRLALAAGVVGAVTTMRERAERSLAIATADDVPLSADTTQAMTLAALGAYLHGEEPNPDYIAAALAGHARRDGSIGPVGGCHAQVVGLLLQFERAADKGAAAEAVRHCLLELLAKHPAPVTSSGLIPHAVWVMLRVHEPHSALLLVERARIAIGDTPEITVARAALAQAANRPNTTRTLLDPLLAIADTLHPVTAITGWLLHALSQQDSSSSAKVHSGIEKALRTAAPERILRPFFDIPHAVDLLDTYAGRFGNYDAFAELIRRHPNSRQRASNPPLTDTEMVVLKQLPSGRTAQQIATDLGVSINTVKTHLRGIYSKLDANSRLGAMDRARHSGWL
ncbi:LuxR C-terminal-related transcriptional regulator [Nocardia sp. NBC_01327]|uniref:LuxR C-terminal-related transcriptional regulator n=1 Tax=Nocardia sp. NBC_01327 TaxID=2903593 RepID=UPI002E153D67|nr:LuxR C-terminal-related transcriptional regulator [Nocardia sp. NBC_01327]